MTTLVAVPTLVDECAPRPRAGGWGVLEHITALAFLLWCAGPMVESTGGQGSGVCAIALGLLALFFVTARPWAHVRLGVLVVSLLVPLGALLTCLAAPSGWLTADSLASETLAAIAVPTIAAYARTDGRRRAVVLAVLLAGVWEFEQGYVAFWGGGDSSKAMVGTFYWWNPFAAYVMVAALVGLAVALHLRGWTAAVGVAASAVCGTGVLLSSSRATVLLMGAGGALIVLASLLAAPVARKRVVATALLAGASLIAFRFTVSGPPFFPHRPGVLGSIQQRQEHGGGTVSANAGHRLEYWQRAEAVLRAHPLFGAGGHTLASASTPLVAPGTSSSPLAHNGYLQVLADQGLLGGGPFILACLAAVGLASWLLVRSLGEPRGLRSALCQGGGIALLCAMAHSAVDFDWTYPSSLLLAGVMGGVLVSLATRPARGPSVGARVWAVATVCLIALAATAGWQWDSTGKDVRDRPGAAATQAASLHRIGEGHLRDPRWAMQVLLVSNAAGGPSASTPPVDPADVRWALGATRRLASADPDVGLLRALATQQLGDDRGAVQLVEQVMTRLGPPRGTAQVLEAAHVLSAAGDDAAARAVLSRSLPFDPPSLAAIHLKALLALVEDPSHGQVFGPGAPTEGVSS